MRLFPLLETLTSLERFDMDLSQLHGTRVAILLCMTGHRRVFTGRAQYHADGEQANALRIELDGVGQEDGNPAFVIHDDQWTGDVTSDSEYGCDYRIQLCTGS